MIVLDASVAIDWVLRSPTGSRVEAIVNEPGQSVHIPHLWIVEITQVMRRLVRAGRLTSERARQGVGDAADLTAGRYDHEPLLPRVWELRDNLSAYDAVYVALAEVLGATLVTGDARVASAPGHRAAIHYIATEDH